MKLSEGRMLELARFGRNGGQDKEELLSFFKEDQSLMNFAPDGIVRVDPRDGQRIIYASKRGKRSMNISSVIKEIPRSDSSNCPICQGNTTEIWSHRELSEGHTFINKNLFPMLLPAGDDGDLSIDAAHGYHFLQWVSTHHDVDWHNISQEDGEVVFRELMVLEKYLLENVGGHVCIIKNFGKEVGGSQAHAHQQIACTNIMPASMVNDQMYFQRTGRTFTADLLSDIDSSLVVEDFENVSLVVPPFMRRPLMAMAVLKDDSKKHFHQLTDFEVMELVKSIRHLASKYVYLMPRMNRSAAYCITFHNGPGAGIYLEFHPYTQETGGFENLGLWVSTMLPHEAAEYLREID